MLSYFVAGRKVIEDYEKADALVQCEHGTVPYVLVRPAHLTNEEASARYTVSQNGRYHFAMKISRADVANFMLKCTSSKKWDNQPVQLHA